MLRHAAALPPPDAALLRAALVDRLPVPELAALTRRTPRSVRRRLAALVRRVLSPEFAFVVERSHTWPEARARVARALVVMGKTYRETVQELGLSMHTVRRHQTSVLAMCEAARQLARELAGSRRVLRGGGDA